MTLIAVFFAASFPQPTSLRKKVAEEMQNRETKKNKLTYSDFILDKITQLFSSDQFISARVIFSSWKVNTKMLADLLKADVFWRLTYMNHFLIFTDFQVKNTIIYRLDEKYLPAKQTIVRFIDILHLVLRYNLKKIHLFFSPTKNIKTLIQN